MFYTLYFTFFDHCSVFVMFHESTFSIGEKTLQFNFIIPYFRGTLGCSAAQEQEGSLKTVQYLL